MGANTRVPEAEMVKLFMQDVDVVSSVRRQGGTEAYLELLDLFYTDGQRRVELLHKLIDKQDAERYQIEVHGLKSAAANIGANNLSAWAKRHEDSAKNQAYVEENADTLFECYKNVLGEIKRVLKQQNYGQFARRDESNLARIGDEELVTRVREALGQLEDFHSHEAAEAVDALLDCAVPEEARAALTEVQGLLKLYEDDQAEDKLRALLKSLGAEA